MKYTVQQLLPHRDPFVFIDRIADSWDDSLCISTRFCPTPETLFYDPAHNGMPAYLGVEMMAQAIGAFVGKCDLEAGRPAARIGKLLSVRNYHPTVDYFEAGRELTINVRYEMIEEPIGSFYACIVRDGEQLAEAELTLYREPYS